MRQPSLFLLLLVGTAIPCFVDQLNAGELRRATGKPASAYSAARRGYSFLVMQDGQVLYESYANGDSANRIASIFSGTKGFWCVAAAAAVQDGMLDFEEPVRDTITEGGS